MQVESIEISALSNDPANVRQHTEAQIQKLIGALRRWGQTLPLLIDSNNCVRVGNARLEAVRRLGWDRVNVIRMNLSPSEWTALSIADNKLHDESKFDEQSLQQVVMALADEDHELAVAAGYSPDELATLLGGGPQAQEPEVAPEDFPTVDENVHCDFACPKCGYKWSGKAVA